MFRKLLHSLPRTVRGLVTSRYRPELYYMRGFGPASAARRAAEQSAGTAAV